MITCTYRLLGADRRPYPRSAPGTFGGDRRQRISRRPDCSSTPRWLARGHDARQRVFFADGAITVAAGHRPCAVCLPRAYHAWRSGRLGTEQEHRHAR